MEPGIKAMNRELPAVADVLARIGDKWTVYVVGLLSNGPMRFNEIRRAVGGISQRMLTLTLARAGTRWAGDTNRLSDHPAARRLRADRISGAR